MKKNNRLLKLLKCLLEPKASKCQVASLYFMYISVQGFILHVYMKKDNNNNKTIQTNTKLTVVSRKKFEKDKNKKIALPVFKSSFLHMLVIEHIFSSSSPTCKINYVNMQEKLI